ncbi:MAG: hypothetical protein IJ157_01120 [Clostridia bacterium]|nr:hypothetical protein [Clostridia bacterium]
MSEEKLSCAALPLRADQSVYALVIGSREGMNSLLGSRSERLKRRINADEWALKAEVRCLISDEGAAVIAREDDRNVPETLAGMAVRMLWQRFRKGLPGWTLLPCAPVIHNGQHLAEAMIACAVRWKLPADFLRWLVTDNACCSTMTDCAWWLIETERPIPVPEVAESIVYVKSLAPYAERNRRMLGGAGVIVAAAGLLCGHETVGAAMRDESLRALLGTALIHEIVPCLPALGEDGLAYAARVTAFLENACGGEAWPAVGENLISRFVACVLPALADYEKKEAALPPCLCFALSALIMLYAGIRKNAQGEYVLPAEEREIGLSDSPAALAAFSHMSCDMPPESLAYAALSDREVWGCDLREIEGLEDQVTNQLRDMQLLGARAAMLTASEMRP